MSATWERLLVALGKEGLLGGDSLFLGICHDDPEVTPSNKLRYDACVTIDQAFEPGPEIGAQTISGGEYVVATHFGFTPPWIIPTPDYLDFGCLAADASSARSRALKSI